MATRTTRTLAFLGATGRMGFALAVAHAKAGHDVIIGSRDAARADEAVARAKQQLKGVADAGAVEGAELKAAAQKADVVFLVYGGFVNENKEQELAQRAATLQQLAPSLAGKVVVDCTNIGYLVGEEAWGQTSSLLLNMAAAGGVDIKWACAWKHVPWTTLEAGGCPDSPWSVMVCADDADAKAVVMELVNSVSGFKALDAGGAAETKIVELIGPMWLFTLMKNIFAGGISTEKNPGWRFGY